MKAQIDKVEDLTGDMDPKTNFSLIVIQTELERYKFLVRSYLRVRIAKVCVVMFCFCHKEKRNMLDCATAFLT